MFTKNYLEYNSRAIDKAWGGKKAQKSEMESLEEINNLRSFSEIEESMNKIFSCFNKKLKSALKNRELMPREKFKRYNELSGLKREISLTFSDHIKRLNTVSDYEKSWLNFKQQFFLVLHNYFDIESELESKLNPDVNVKKRKGNEINMEKSEAQQFLAGLIIKDPGGAKKAISAYRTVAEDTYGLPAEKANGEKSESFNSIESGIYGLAAAYCYYSNKDGQEIIFANPKIDANEETDFFLVNASAASQEEKDEIIKLSDADFNKIDEAREEIKQYITKVQTKCKRNYHLPVEEIIYNYEENKMYMGEEDKEGKPFVADYKSKDCPCYMTFFDLKCRQKGVNGKFITFDFNKANKIVENN